MTDETTTTTEDKASNSELSEIFERLLEGGPENLSGEDKERLSAASNSDVGAVQAILKFALDEAGGDFNAAMRRIVIAAAAGVKILDMPKDKFLIAAEMAYDMVAVSEVEDEEEDKGDD